MRRTITHPWSAACALLAAVLASSSAAAQSSAAAAPADDPFSRHRWNLELATHGAIETWNYNGSHEDMTSIDTGITYGVGRGVTLKMRSALYRVWQRGTDGYLFGVTTGVRSRILRHDRWSLFWEFEVGVSESDTYVPPRGTRFNYLALGGGGATLRIRPGVHALLGLRWVHVSNNGLAGRNRNPDIEAVGPTAGLLIGF